MIRRHAALVLILAVLLVGAALRAYAAKQAKAPRFTAFADRQVYATGETPLVTLRLENTSSSLIKVIPSYAFVSKVRVRKLLGPKRYRLIKPIEATAIDCLTDVPADLAMVSLGPNQEVSFPYPNVHKSHHAFGEQAEAAQIRLVVEVETIRSANDEAECSVMMHPLPAPGSYELTFFYRYMPNLKSDGSPGKGHRILKSDPLVLTIQ